MDKSRFSIYWKPRFLFLGFYLEIGLDSILYFRGKYLIIGYLLLSLAMAIYFVAFV
jgi:hypothetical protein